MTGFESINPANGERLHQTAFMSENDIITRLDAQQQAWQTHSGLSLHERLRWLQAFGAELVSNQTALATLLTREVGKPISHSMAELEKTRQLVDYLYREASSALAPETLRGGVSRCWQPLGGVLGIMPWNYPVWQVCRFALAALVAGNTVALKPAPNVLLATQRLAQLLAQAGVPQGWFEVYPASVASVALMYDHGHIQQVHFTGSTEAGRRIAAECGQRLIPTTLELGGSDAWLLTPRGDVARFVQTALVSRMNNSGQSCLCAKRWLVPREHLDQVLGLLETGLKRYVPQPPEQLECHLGPLARPDIVQRLTEQWQAMQPFALQHSDALQVSGNFVSPGWAVFEDPLANPVWRQEVFGPVVQIAVYDDLSQAVTWANASPYGLGASVWDENETEAQSLAKQLRTANVGINQPMRSRIDVAFGGLGDSGWGVELGHEGLRALCRQQTQYG
ncbi:MAG: aldehyde dehydrogenase family protein [Saccharospirillum sp.]